MMELCKIHIQEVLIRSALAKNAKGSLIAELAMGVKERYMEISSGLKSLNRHYDNLSDAFKLYLNLKVAYFEGLALAQIAKFNDENEK